MFTRTQYMATHREPGSYARYYGEIIDAVGGPEAFRSKIPVPIEDIRWALLMLRDEHLNTIPLGTWDAVLPFMPYGTKTALQRRGDTYSLGNCVCILKEASRLLAMKAEG